MPIICLPSPSMHTHSHTNGYIGRGRMECGEWQRLQRRAAETNSGGRVGRVELSSTLLSATVRCSCELVDRQKRGQQWLSSPASITTTITDIAYKHIAVVCLRFSLCRYFRCCLYGRFWLVILDDNTKVKSVLNDIWRMKIALEV